MDRLPELRCTIPTSLLMTKTLAEKGNNGFSMFAGLTHGLNSGGGAEMK